MTGSQSTDCNDNGKCTCKTNLITGKKCSECIDGRINFPECSGTLSYTSMQPLSVLSQRTIRLCFECTCKQS